MPNKSCTLIGHEFIRFMHIYLGFSNSDLGLNLYKLCPDWIKCVLIF
jgi:hypothetical protein